MGITISDRLVPTQIDKIVLDAINIQFNNINQSQFNSNISTALANRYTKAEVDSLVNALTSMQVEIVEALPTEDISSTTIYLIQNGNIYVEYLYVNGTWREIGTTDIDLAEYAKTEDLCNVKDLCDALEVNFDTFKNKFNAAVTVNDEAHETFDSYIQNLSSAIITMRDKIAELEKAINNITPSSIDTIDSSKVTYNDTNVKAVLDQLLYKAPTVSVSISRPAVKTYEYGSTVQSIEGIITFKTYNNIVKLLTLYYRIGSTTASTTITVSEGAASATFKLPINLDKSIAIYAKIKDDKDKEVTSTEQYINFMYKSFYFASDKERIVAGNIPKEGGKLVASKALGTININCTPTNKYAYITIPKVYCTADPTITDANNLPITLPDSCIYEIDSYVNAQGVIVPMKVYRLNNTFDGVITINIK